MKKETKVNASKLKLVYDKSKINYDKSKNVYDTTELIYGQESGIKAFEFGLKMDQKGYNIFFEGPTGVGKTMYVKRFLNQTAKDKKPPKDICYINNFDREDEPISVVLECGKGKEFKKDMEEFVSSLKLHLKQSLDSKEVETHKKKYKENLEAQKKQIIENLNLETKPKGFEVIQGPTGVFMLPVYKGKTLQKEEYEKLDNKTKIQYEGRSKEIQELIFVALTKIRKVEEEINKEIENWDSKVVLQTLNILMEDLEKKYSKNEKIKEYLEKIKEEIYQNSSKYLQEDEKNIFAPQGMIKSNVWNKLKVNLFVDNSKTKGAPVIMDLDYSFDNIFGKVEYTNQFGALSTDFTKIKPGLLHLANGGYIVFQAMELLRNPYAYEMLKKILKTEKIGIENNPENRMPMVMMTLKPESIDFNAKIIIIGSSRIYSKLFYYDPDYSKLFKIKTEFYEKAPITDENVDKLCKFISSYIIQEKLLDLNIEAVAKVIEYASKLAEDQTKLSTNFAEIGRLIAEASAWAESEDQKEVTEKHIQKALYERKERVKKYYKISKSFFETKKLLLDTKGYKVGEINGLSVVSTSDFSFGIPSKITANTFLGNGRISHVENETKMSGTVHTKGVSILQGYFAEKYGQKMPLSMGASLTFEQTYVKVDGDSASSTEIYALLSSLSGVPINQGIAVTGSVNQKGEIQPIGGVNYKIQGFYDICKINGLDGTQGVMIPKQNLVNLHLDDEIIKSVENGEFNIYAVSTLDEGIEILTGKKAGVEDKNGNYPKDTINYLVIEKLKKYHINKKELDQYLTYNTKNKDIKNEDIKNSKESKKSKVNKKNKKEKK